MTLRRETYARKLSNRIRRANKLNGCTVTARRSRRETKRWGDGPWATEPNRVEWYHAGLPCLVQRHVIMGHWCGYVAVPPGHPWHSVHPDEVHAGVQGGFTYSGPCSRVICHVPRRGEPDNVWWLGFDFAHADDIVPGLAHMGVGQWPEAVYRTVHYVMSEARHVADQAAYGTRWRAA